MTKRNIQWAWKVLTSKSFAVMTDSETAIQIDVLDPFEMEDLTTLLGQQQSFKVFNERFTQLEIDHEQAVHLLKRRANAKDKKRAKQV
jgi:hypothetical protein